MVGSKSFNSSASPIAYLLEKSREISQDLNFFAAQVSVAFLYFLYKKRLGALGQSRVELDLYGNLYDRKLSASIMRHNVPAPPKVRHDNA